jgi:hypothetical protein
VDVTIASGTLSRIRQNGVSRKQYFDRAYWPSQVEVQVEWVSYKLPGIMPSEN